MRRLWTLTLLSLSALLIPTTLRAGELLLRKGYDNAKDTFVEVSSVFGSAANHGSLPFRITIRNTTGSTKTWTVTLREGLSGHSLSTETTIRIPVENGAEVTREVYLPYAPGFLTYNSRSLTVKVLAPGLEMETHNEWSRLPEVIPLLGMSKALAQRNLALLDEEVKNRGSNNPYFAKSFDPKELPVDWIGYSGLDGLLLDEASWRTLSAAQRQALVTWVRLGGLLDLYSTSKIEPDSLGLPITDTNKSDDRWNLGVGGIRLYTWDGSNLPITILKHYEKLTGLDGYLEHDYHSKWGLYSMLGMKKSHPIFVFLLLAIFAVIVAPINLFYLAKSGRRHRLFITTPIISVAACLLTIASIFLIDGIGGNGLRAVLADLQPVAEGSQLHIIQEQLSHSGVIVNSGFKTGRKYDLNPVNLPRGRFNPFSSQSKRSTVYHLSDGAYTGQLFRSRSEQGFLLRSVEPGRARIELRPTENGMPVLISNLSQEITNLLYRDDAGQLWAMPADTTVAPGARILLEQVDKVTKPAWLSEAAAAFSSHNSASIATLQKERNRFFAELRNPEAIALSTHPQIRWQKTFLVFTGTPQPSASTSSTTSP